VRVHRLERVQRVPLPLEEAFAFYGSADNLERITPPWLRFEIQEPRPGRLAAGTLLHYSLVLHRFPVRWTTQIRTWEPPHRFVDVQLRGPYRLWEHTHTFEDAGEQGTLVRDRVEYAAPGGTLIDRLFVRKDLERIFNYRARELMIWAAGAATLPPRPASGSR